ncbi:agamous-like MADS-box protein AGL62 [Vicia villosa]|uniref:agamous-like MADS-box protein AGL62 n=1 Tax=Vicia villosa TaxID=3911 RepID=UPI00273C962F|nr:agamous-like MADS-box protein AGL62 [Vicia villosa]
MSTEKKGRGRQKIEMKKMSNDSNLQVTFSKRRSGLFKKASELCTLCDADVALVIFSPGDKVFSFGHPHVDTVIDRYLSRAPPQNNGTMQFIEARHSAIVRELNCHLTQINSMLDNEKKSGDQLGHYLKANEAQFWSASPIDKMNRPQLEFFQRGLEELKKRVAQHAERIVTQGAHTQTIPFFVGNSSNSSMPLHHQGNPQHAQIFQPPFFQNPMMQPHLFDFNNKGGSDGNNPSGFF